MKNVYKTLKYHSSSKVLAIQNILECHIAIYAKSVCYGSDAIQMKGF